jgi:hypothetical protein
MFELQLVQLLLGLLHSELQAGHNEQAVAKIQVCHSAGVVCNIVHVLVYVIGQVS